MNVASTLENRLQISAAGGKRRLLRAINHRRLAEDAKRYRIILPLRLCELLRAASSKVVSLRRAALEFAFDEPRASITRQLNRGALAIAREQRCRLHLG